VEGFKHDLRILVKLSMPKVHSDDFVEGS